MVLSRARTYDKQFWDKAEGVEAGARGGTSALAEQAQNQQDKAGQAGAPAGSAAATTAAETQAKENLPKAPIQSNSKEVSFKGLLART